MFYDDFQDEWIKKETVMTEYIPALEDLFVNMKELVTTNGNWTAELNDTWIGEFQPNPRPRHWKGQHVASQ